MKETVRKVVGAALVGLFIWLLGDDPFRIEPDDADKIEAAETRSEKIDDWSDAVGNDDWRDTA